MYVALPATPALVAVRSGRKRTPPARLRTHGRVCSRAAARCGAPADAAMYNDVF